MARGKTLNELVTDLRLEARYDSNPATSISVLPHMQQAIRSTQEFLYDEFDWPFLKVQRDIPLEAGQRYYDFPEDINLERVQRVDVLYGNVWQPVIRGIDLDDYTTHDSDAGERTDPVLKWDVRDTGDSEQMEIWPIPASNGMKVRVRGIRNLKPLVEDSDRADLDDMMIVLYAAGELLATSDPKTAQVKLARGKARRDTMEGRVMKTRNNTFSMNGPPPDENYRQLDRVTAVHKQLDGG